jgi:hypothetical protein
MLEVNQKRHAIYPLAPLYSVLTDAFAMHGSKVRSKGVRTAQFKIEAFDHQI